MGKNLNKKSHQRRYSVSNKPDGLGNIKSANPPKMFTLISNQGENNLIF